MNVRDQLAELVTDYESNVWRLRVDYEPSIGPDWYLHWDTHDRFAANTTLTKINTVLGTSLSLLSEEEINLVRQIRVVHEEFDKAILEYPQALDHLAAKAAIKYRDKVRLITDELLTLLRAGIHSDEFADMSPAELGSLVPEDIEMFVVHAWQEACRDYENECYMSAIAMCGRLIETYLGSIYATVCGIEKGQEKMGIDAMLNRLRNAGYPFQSGMGDVMTVIAKHRNKAVHKSVVIASQDQARGIIALTKDVLKTQKR